MAYIDDLHTTIDDSYRNLLHGLTPGIKQLLVTGKVYQKAILNAVHSSRAYIDCIEALSSSAKKSKDKSVTNIGVALQEISKVLKEVNAQFEETSNVFLKDVLTPLERNIDKDTKSFQRDFKMYRAAHKNHVVPWKRANDNLQRHRKKRKNAHVFDQKGKELEREMNVKKDAMVRYHGDGLRKILLQQRRKYVELLDSILVGIRDSAYYSRKRSHEQMTSRLELWASLCNNPNILPPMTEQLILQLTSGLPSDVAGDEFLSDVMPRTNSFNHLPGDHSLTPTTERYDGRATASMMNLHSALKNVKTPQRALPEDDSDFAPADDSGPSSPDSTMQALETTNKEVESYGTKSPSKPRVPDHSGESAVAMVPLPTGTVVKACCSVSSSPNQLSYEVGDEIEVQEDTFQQWQLGKNIRTNQISWFLKDMLGTTKTPLIPKISGDYSNTSLVDHFPPPPLYMSGGRPEGLPAHPSDTDSGQGEESGGSLQRNMQFPPPRPDTDWRHIVTQAKAQQQQQVMNSYSNHRNISSSSSQRSISPPPPPPPGEEDMYPYGRPPLNYMMPYEHPYINYSNNHYPRPELLYRPHEMYPKPISQPRQPPSSQPPRESAGKGWSQLQQLVKKPVMRPGTHPPKHPPQKQDVPRPSTTKNLQGRGTNKTNNNNNNDNLDTTTTTLSRTPSQRSFKNKPAPPPPGRTPTTSLSRSTSGASAKPDPRAQARRGLH